MREEKEWATFTLTFSCFECHISISLSWQGVFDLILCNIVQFSDILKDLWSILKDGNLFVDCKYCFIFLNHLLDCRMNSSWRFGCTWWRSSFEFIDSTFKCVNNKSWLLPNFLRNFCILKFLINLCCIPAWRIFDFNSIESTDMLLVIQFSRRIYISQIMHRLILIVNNLNLIEFSDTFKYNMHQLNVQTWR